jgi:hypothetical protein
MWRAMLLLVLVGCASVRAPEPPTPTPVPPALQRLPGTGFSITGHGSAETDEITPDYGGTLSIGIDVVTLSHSGQSTFIVTALQDGESEIVTQAIGNYHGQRPLVVMGAVTFTITADGDWSLKVQPMSSGGMPAFKGSGDLVSAYFTPPSPRNWSIAHDGATFSVYAHCVGGSTLVADRAGPFQDTSSITFDRGPCFWEVRADGVWSLQPAT